MINYTAFSKLNGTGEQPSSFPTIRYVHGPTVESYDGEHDEQAMNAWIQSKNVIINRGSNKKGKTMHGGRKKRPNKKLRRTKKRDVSILFRK